MMTHFHRYTSSKKSIDASKLNQFSILDVPFTSSKFEQDYLAKIKDIYIESITPSIFDYGSLLSVPGLIHDSFLNSKLLQKLQSKHTDKGTKRAISPLSCLESLLEDIKAQGLQRPIIISCREYTSLLIKSFIVSDSKEIQFIHIGQDNQNVDPMMEELSDTLKFQTKMNTGTCYLDSNKSLGEYDLSTGKEIYLTIDLKSIDQNYGGICQEGILPHNLISFLKDIPSNTKIIGLDIIGFYEQAEYQSKLAPAKETHQCILKLLFKNLQELNFSCQ